MLPFLSVLRTALHGIDVVFAQFTLDYRVIVPKDETVLVCLILDDAHLWHSHSFACSCRSGPDGRRNVEQNSNIRAEVVHVVQLETAQLDDIVFVRVFCHLQSQTLPDVSSQSGIIASLFENMVYE